MRHPVPCPRCLRMQEDAGFAGSLERYAASLPAHQCTDEHTYRARLSACQQCDALLEGACRYCGCFVLVRAKKKGLSCPHPGGSRWPEPSAKPEEKG